MSQRTPVGSGSGPEPVGGGPKAHASETTGVGRLAAVLASVVPVLTSASAAGAATPAVADSSGVGTWTQTGPMATARNTHTATLLSDGRALVAGGWTLDRQVLASAEGYDPATNTWNQTGGTATAPAVPPPSGTRTEASGNGAGTSNRT